LLKHTEVPSPEVQNPNSAAYSLDSDPKLGHLATARQAAICDCVHHQFFPVYEQYIKLCITAIWSF